MLVIEAPSSVARLVVYDELMGNGLCLGSDVHLPISCQVLSHFCNLVSIRGEEATGFDTECDRALLVQNF